jgi:hypothetical protein
MFVSGSSLMRPGLGRDAFPLRMARAVAEQRTLVACLVLLTLFGGVLRMVGTSWDDREHLHPDERYISSVADNIDWPSGLAGYFDVEKSPLSPYNIDKGRDYVYGLMPLLATKLVATAVGQDGYGTLNLVGRRLAAALDTAAIILVFLVTRLLLEGHGRRRAGLGALAGAGLYAFAVTGIQHAHFFTTDAWLAFFGLLTVYLALLSVHHRGPGRASWLVPALGASVGLTVACKASGALMVIPVLIALVARAVLVQLGSGVRATALRLAADAGLALITAYVTFRAVSPYTFAHSSWLDVSINESFRSALEGQARLVAGPSDFPPSYQWQLSPRVWSPLENLALWQLGLPFAVAAGCGLAVLLLRIAREGIVWARRRMPLDEPGVIDLAGRLMVFCAVVAPFVYFATRFVHSGRYLVPIVPLLAVSAGYGVGVLAARHRPAAVVLGVAVVAATALYATAFDRIYTRQNTRIAASHWIERNVAAGATIANEHWDDPLPIGGRWGETEAQARDLGGYRGVLLPVFDRDDAAKLRRLYDDLRVSDYYVLSSPRAWNTIGRLPGQFPLMTRFYDELFAGRLGFSPVASFTSRPGLLGLELDDLRAEEAFWVYDHPPVRILRRDGPLRWGQFRAALCRDPPPTYCT